MTFSTVMGQGEGGPGWGGGGGAGLQLLGRGWCVVTRSLVKTQAEVLPKAAG